MENTTNVCKRCLIREMAEEGHIQSIQQYVDRIDEHLKTTKEEYEYRLACCKECDQLLSGMCRVCGCFVEMRAAVARHSCPGVDKRW